MNKKLRYSQKSSEISFLLACFKRLVHNVNYTTQNVTCENFEGFFCNYNLKEIIKTYNVLYQLKKRECPVYINE